MKIAKYLSLPMAAVTLLFSLSVQAVNPTNVSGLVVTWDNIDANSSGTVRVVVSQVAGGLRFTSHGSCSPTPCVHSTVVAYPHSAGVSSNAAVGFTAYRNSGFKYERYSAMRTGQYLRMDAFSTFASGDSRKNYAKTEYFLRN